MSLSIYLQGGLGNRLFEIASAMGIADSIGKKFVIDPRLQTHNVHQSANSQSDYDYFTRKFPVKPLLNSPSVLPEEGTKFACYTLNPQMLSFLKSTQNDLVVEGYRQNEKYFSNVEGKVRAQFSIPKWKRDEFVVEKKLIDNPEKSMFIHLRLGDYKGNPMHDVGVNSSLYYRDSFVKYFLSDLSSDSSSKIENIYVFSDDVNWCRQNVLDEQVNVLRLPSEVFQSNKLKLIDPSQLKVNEVESMWLMSLCELGGICANSTFSWWAAYLIGNPAKKIIFPSKWSPRPEFDTGDIYFKGSHVVDIRF